MKCEKQTTGALRKVLFKEISDLRSGKSTPSRGRTVASLGNAIVGAVIAEAEIMDKTGIKTEFGKLGLCDKN